MFQWLKTEETKIREEFNHHIMEWESEAAGLEAKIKALEATLVSGIEQDVAYMKGRVAELRARIEHLKKFL